MGPATAAEPSPKSMMEAVIVPSGSVLAEVSAVTVTGAVPEPGVTVSAAPGEAFTLMVWVAEALPSASSVTVAVTVYVFAVVYWWVAIGPGSAELPSPKSMLEDAIGPVLAVLAEISAVTVTGAVPESGETVRTALGNGFCGTNAVATERWFFSDAFPT